MPLTPPLFVYSKQEALQEQSVAEVQAGRRVAELEEVTLAEGKKYGSVAEEVEAKRRKLDRLEKRLAELQADIRDAYRDFQQVPLWMAPVVDDYEQNNLQQVFGYLRAVFILSFKRYHCLATCVPRNPQEKEGLLDQVRALQQQVELKELLCELFIQPRHVARARKGAVWDDDEQAWRIVLQAGGASAPIGGQVRG